MSKPIAAAHVAHLLPSFVASTLAPDERRAVLTHLAGCPACRAELAAWGAIRDALREPSPALPADDATMTEVWRRVDANPKIESPLHTTNPGGTGHEIGPVAVTPAPRRAAISGTVEPGDRRDAAGRATDPLLAPAPQTWSALRQATQPRRPLAQLAAAAVVLLALGLGYVTLGPGRLDRGAPVQHLAAPEPAPPGRGEIAEASLLDVVIPAAYVPNWDLAYIGLALHGIPPATTSTWAKPALRVEYVLEGTYRVRSAGPSMMMRRGTTTPEDVPAGTELVMRPGDTLIAPAETTSDYVTDESTAALLLSWALVEDPDYQHAKPLSWLSHDFHLRHNLRLQGGAMSLHLRRIDLGPDAVLAAPDDPLQLINQADFLGSTITQTSEGVRRNIGEATATLYSSTVSPSGTGTLMP